MNASRKWPGSRGFTLIELLVAVALLGISMTLVLGVYRSVFFIAEQVDRKGTYQSQTALLIDQLQRDLYGIYKGRSGFFRADLEPEGSGDMVLFEFTTTSQLRFSEAAPAESLVVVRYLLKESGNSRTFHLYRIEIPLFYADPRAGLSGPASILVNERVVDCRLSFGDRYGSFYERWEARSSAMTDGPDDDRFPRLVRIELVLAEGPEEGAQTRSLTHAIAIPVSRHAPAAVLEES